MVQPSPRQGGNKQPIVLPQQRIDVVRAGGGEEFEFNDTSQEMPGKQKLVDSGRNGASGHGKNDQGEIRIKYTDSAKTETNQNVQMLFKDPGQGRSEAVEIKVNFAMAYGDTQNFSLPIYSGNFAFKCTFSKKENEPESKIDIIHNSCHID